MRPCLQPRRSILGRSDTTIRPRWAFPRDYAGGIHARRQVELRLRKDHRPMSADVDAVIQRICAPSLPSAPRVENAPASDLQRFLLSYLTMHVVTKMQPGVVNLFDALRFPMTTTKEPGFGELPMIHLGAGVATERPSDAVIIESAEVTGMDAFEEVVKVEDIHQLRDPLREQLLEIAKQHAA